MTINKNVSLTTLEKFQRVAWDVDGVLLGHPRSLIFSRFIAENPYNQQHYIVTHRSHGYERRIWLEFRQQGSNLISSDFASVLNVPERFYEAYRDYEMTNDDFGGDLPPDVEAYLTWKGRVCKEVGVQVLIDDSPDLVSRGCALHDIPHIHPDEL